MKQFNWNSAKNGQLLAERHISFDDILLNIKQGRLLDDIEHPNHDKYPAQRVLVMDIAGYIYLVPYVESDDEIFLKTIIPSRKATKKYKGGDL